MLPARGFIFAPRAFGHLRTEGATGLGGQCLFLVELFSDHDLFISNTLYNDPTAKQIVEERDRDAHCEVYEGKVLIVR